MKTFFALITLFLAARMGLADVSMEAEIPLEVDEGIRDLKGSSKGSKSAAGSGSGCKAKVPGGPLIMKVKKIEKATTETEIITTWVAPFKVKKDKTEGEAYFTQIATGDKTCVQNLIVQFNKNTHLAFTGACKQRIMALTGGTGKYPCASGQAKIASSSKTLELDINKIECNCSP